MAVLVGDVLFARTGDPMLVRDKDLKTGNVALDRDFPTVQEHAREALKKGLSPAQREAYNSVLSDVSDTDRRREIDELSERIGSLKASGADARVVRYLEQELTFRMTKERYTPRHLTVDPKNISSID